MLIKLEFDTEFPFADISAPKKQAGKLTVLKESFLTKQKQTIEKDLSDDNERFNVLVEAMSEVVKEYMEKNEKLKEDIEMMKRAGLDKEEVMQKYEKVQKKVEVFKTKVEKRTLKTDITDKEREEYEKLITRIEKNELSSIKEDEYKRLVLDTFEGNTRNEENKEEQQ